MEMVARQCGDPTRTHTYRIFGACMLALLIGTVALCAYTRNNDFPSGYHPDEHGKAVQLLRTTDTWDFHHPLLLLESTNLVRAVFQVPPDARAIVIAGRWT